MFILIKCLCTSCGYELLVTRCRGHELHVNPSVKIYIYSITAAVPNDCAPKIYFIASVANGCVCALLGPYSRKVLDLARS